MPTISGLICRWMNQLSEAELVEACRNGSSVAFAELVNRYKNLVFGVISQVVSDRSRVEDLAQEVFLKVHRGLPSFRGDAKLSTWIYRIVRNVCSESSTRLHVMVSIDERTEDGRLRYEPSAADRAFSDLERRDLLEKAITRLPVDQRFLISAHYFGGQQYHELADILEMPMGTVKTLLHRAKQRLREMIEQRTVHSES
jgi:RNA polymerase sigma-70 factor (ECF subfamily)